jgi:ABC-2 type transport system permease protein
MLTAGEWLTLDVVALLLVLPPTFLAVMGLAFVVAGLTIVYKQVGAFLQLLQFVLMGIAFVPLTAAPLVELAPTAKGIDMIRQVMAAGTPLSAFTGTDWAVLLGTGVFTFVLGLAAYQLFERRAMTRGVLGHY